MHKPTPPPPSAKKATVRIGMPQKPQGADTIKLHLPASNKPAAQPPAAPPTQKNVAPIQNIPTAAPVPATPLTPPPVAPPITPTNSPQTQTETQATTEIKPENKQWTDEELIAVGWTAEQIAARPDRQKPTTPPAPVTPTPPAPVTPTPPVPLANIVSQEQPKPPQNIPDQGVPTDTPRNLPEPVSPSNQQDSINTEEIKTLIRNMNLALEDVKKIKKQDLISCLLAAISAILTLGIVIVLAINS